jgi:LmbE family N-acetylglucosaminyl deacetylase
METRKLMAILAHPDDESMGTGGVLAKYSAEGAETCVITATRGERGWFGSPEDYPGPSALGRIRQKELYAAAEKLGVHQVHLLDYMDGELDRANPQTIIVELADHIRRFKPQVVVTFDPKGYYGHPDHIAISQFATAAVLAAANPDTPSPASLPHHRAAKLYYLAANQETQAAYQAAFGDLVMHIDGVERRSSPWEDWAITTRVDTHVYWQQVWQAISQHCSQLPGYQSLLDLPQETHKKLWGEQTFYRALSLVNSGRAVEDDLFAGLNVSGYADFIPQTRLPVNTPVLR